MLLDEDFNLRWTSEPGLDLLLKDWKTQDVPVKHTENMSIANEILSPRKPIINSSGIAE